MIKSQQEFKSEIRKNMRDGNGEILITHLLNTTEDLKAQARLFAKLTIEKGCSQDIIYFQRRRDMLYTAGSCKT